MQRLSELEKANEQLKIEIKERKRTESILRDTLDRLNKTEQKYRTVANFTYDWEYWIGPDDRLIYVSPSCERVSGYSVQDFMDNPSLFREIIVPQDREMWDRHYCDARQELKPREIQFRIHRRDGEIRWIEHACQPVVDNTGCSLGFRASNRDVTARKQVEEELGRSENEKSSILNSTSEIIAFHDLDHNIKWVNRAYLEATGLSLSKVKGQKCYHMWGLDRLCTNCPVSKAIETGEPHEGELTPQNQEHWPPDQGCWAVRATPMKNDDGSVIGAIEVSYDITERKVAEEEMMKSQERFRRLMEQSPLAIEILTPEGQIRQVNAAWMRLWGLNEEETGQVLKNYNMLTDKQVKDLGIAPLVERAFAGEHVVLPAIKYSGTRALNEIGLEDLEARSPWIECHLYSVKDANGETECVVNTYLDITDRKQAESELRNAFSEIEQLKNQLEAESAYLQNEIKLEHNFENIIGQSESLKYVLNRVEQVAPMDSPVLIMGETGTGKELMARAIHKLSPRGKRALVKVNCAALPGELIESEMFGREKGAYTGATTTQIGRFELANGSTLFLDEIGELPLELQAKLLRVLESGDFERLGSSRTLHSDARIIATTNRVLEEEVRKGRFREDLWYRLKVFPITVPPLREHPEDIPLLVKWFVDQLAKKMGKGVAEISKRTMQMLQSYPWPGNVRELKHAVEGALITAQGEKLNFELPQIADTALSDFKSFEEMERDYILRVLKAKNWRIGGENSAASTLGMHVNTLRGRMKKLGIKRPKP